MFESNKPSVRQNQKTNTQNVYFIEKKILKQN